MRLTSALLAALASAKAGAAGIADTPAAALTAKAVLTKVRRDRLNFDVLISLLFSFHVNGGCR